MTYGAVRFQQRLLLNWACYGIPVYVETSVISYYTARPSRDIVTAARQTITQEWWNEARRRYEIYISVLIVEEANAGDAVAAQRRSDALSGLRFWRLTMPLCHWPSI